MYTCLIAGLADTFNFLLQSLLDLMYTCSKTCALGSALRPDAICSDVRTAAAAIADFAVEPEGREILRREGAIRPLVLLLEEGIESTAAEQAAKALMTLAASEINKVGLPNPLHPITRS